MLVVWGEISTIKERREKKQKNNNNKANILGFLSMPSISHFNPVYTKPSQSFSSHVKKPEGKFIAWEHTPVNKRLCLSKTAH